ncbi:MAG: EfeM/EfeO family lipoprotein [Deltaproteobacteria bacterium]|nr:EfeM/EfeO family lipoprotein [Deltaproteobacteria bacterium]
MKCTALFAATTLFACGGKSDSEFRAEVTAAMHVSIATELATLAAAARELQAAAPTHAWDAAADAAAIAAMKTAWRKTRVAYEHVEGAIAPIFPNFDASMDARYDDYLAEIGPAGDANLFDGEGATGMHSIERIVFSAEIRGEVIDFESALPGYKAAAYPSTEAEAMAFKTQLVQRLVADADALAAQWQPAAIDIGAAYQGLVGLMNEQAEKVNKAATGEEESRYADVTLFDLRNNLDGTRAVYELFRDWVAERDGGEADGQIIARLDSLAQLYRGHAGDALPPVPATWSSDDPTAADLATPFGVMWQRVHEEVDPNVDGSVVFEMNEIAALLGFPEFVEG